MPDLIRTLGILKITSVQTLSPFFEALTSEINHRSIAGLLAVLVLLLHFWVIVLLMQPSDNDKIKTPLKVMEVVLVEKPKPEPKKEIKPPAPPKPAPSKPAPPKQVQPKKQDVKPPVKKKAPITPKPVERPKLKAQKVGAEQIPITAQPSTSKSELKPQAAVSIPHPAVVSKPVAKPPGNGDAKSKGVSSGVVELGCPKPAYPMRAQSRHIEGWVKVELAISATGAVTNAGVVGAQPSGIFESTALDAARKCRFKPKMVNGKAVPVVAVKKLTFKF